MDFHKGAIKTNRLEQRNQATFFLAKFWKGNAVDETDKIESEYSNNSRTAGGSGDSIQEGNLFLAICVSR